MHARAGRRDERGFTMIEVMVALLVTAIAVIGIVALYMTGTKASSYSRHATEAAALANDKLEALRTAALPATGNESGPIDEQGQPGGVFDRSWEVATVGTDYYALEVVVSWEEDADTRTVRVYGRRAL